MLAEIIANNKKKLLINTQSIYIIKYIFLF